MGRFWLMRGLCSTQVILNCCFTYLILWSRDHFTTLTLFEIIQGTIFLIKFRPSIVPPATKLFKHLPEAAKEANAEKKSKKLDVDTFIFDLELLHCLLQLFTLDLRQELSYLVLTN